MTTHWGNTSLGQVLTERQEKPTEKDLSTGSIRIVSKIAFNDGKIQLREDSNTKTGMILIRPGDLVISGINAAKGAIAIYDEGNTDPIAATIHYGSYIPNKSRVDVKYLWWLLRSNTFRELLNCYVPGGIKTELKAKRLLPIPVPLLSLPEQQRIVAQIEQLAAKVEEANKLRNIALAETKALLTSVLHEFFEERLNGWYKKSMSKCVLINDPQVDPSLPEYARLPHISGENIESKTCKLLPYRTAMEDGIKSGNYLFSPGTILYSKIRPYLQKTVFVEFRGVCSADVYPIKVIDSELDPRFVMWSLVAGPFTEYANRLSGRTRMPKLNRKQLFDYELSYPNISEQRKIISFLDSLQIRLDELKVTQRKIFTEFDALLPSILDKAFKGEL